MNEVSEPSKEKNQNRASIVAGLFAILAGLYPLVIALRLIPIDQRALHAPRWVIGITGAAFLLAGFQILTTGRFSYRITNSIGALIVSILTTILLWIVVGPGERVCTGTFMFSSHVMSEYSCRITFGLGLIIMLPISILAWSQVFKKDKDGP